MTSAERLTLDRLCFEAGLGEAQRLQRMDALSVVWAL